MSFSQLQREYLVVPLNVFSAYLSATWSATAFGDAKKAFAYWFIPWNNAKIVGWSAVYAIEGGTTPELTITLERSTTVLATMTLLDTDATGFRITDLDLPVVYGEVLNLKGMPGAADNFFDGLNVTLEVQIMPDLI